MRYFLFLVCISFVLNGVQGFKLNQNGDKTKALTDSLNAYHDSLILIQIELKACRLANDSARKEIKRVKDFRNHCPAVQDSILKAEKLKRRNNGQNNILQKLEQ